MSKDLEGQHILKAGGARKHPTISRLLQPPFLVVAGIQFPTKMGGGTYQCKLAFGLCLSGRSRHRCKLPCLCVLNRDAQACP